MKFATGGQSTGRLSLPSGCAAVPKEKRVQKSLEIFARLVKQLKDLCQGIHIMSLGWERHIATVLDMASL